MPKRSALCACIMVKKSYLTVLVVNVSGPVAASFKIPEVSGSDGDGPIHRRCKRLSLDYLE